MNICRTSYELTIAGECVAAWTEDRTLPPPKKFALIPADVLAKLAGYSVLAKVINCYRVNGHYAVKLEADKLLFA